MTIFDCVQYVDSIEPNAYDNEQKARWVRECEGKVYAELFLMQPIGFSGLEPWTIMMELLSIPAPYNKIYPRYLQAMIHYANGEYDRYANSMAMFNDAWEDLNIWFGHDYNAADWHRNPMVQCEIPLYAEIVEVETLT